MLLSATLQLNVRIILSDPFSDLSSFYVACVCNHCCRTNQNRLTMSLTHPVSYFQRFFFLLCLFLIDLLELLSFEKLDFFDDESDDDRSGSGSPGTYTFPFFSGKLVGCVGECVGRISDVGSGIFFNWYQVNW